MSRRAKRRFFVLLAMIVIAALAAVTFRAVRAVQQDRLIAQARSEGLAAHQRGDLDSALTRLSYYFEHRKDDLEVNLAFADARSRKPLPHGKHLAEAVELYTTHGLQLLDSGKPDQEHAATERMVLNRLLSLYGQLGMRVEITKTADRILSHEPDHIDALASKGEVLALDGDFDKASELATRLIELDPDNLRWRRLALEIEIGRGRTPDDLIEQCRQWAQAYQSDGRFHLLTASMLLEVDRHEEAAEEMQAAAKLGASAAEVLERSSSVLDVLGMHEQADELIARTIERFPGEMWVREVKIRRHWHHHRLEDAFAELSRAREQIDQLTPALHRLEVLCHIADGEVASAQHALKPLLETAMREQNERDIAWCNAVSGALEATSGNWRERIESLGIALSLAPDDAVLYFLMGDACDDVGENGRALQAYSQAYELDLDWMTAGVAKAQALLQAGRLAEAFDVSQTVVTRSPPDRTSPLLVLAKSYVALQQSGAEHAQSQQDILPELAEALNNLHEQWPEHPEIATLLVETHLIAGHRDQAIEQIRHVMEGTSPAPLLVALAELSLKHDLGLEQELLARAAAQGGRTFEIALLEAQARAEAGQLDDAVQIIDQAIAAIPPNDAQTVDANCARVSFLLAYQHPKAMGDLDDLVGRFPDSAQAQQLALGQAEAWSDVKLIARAMTNLKSILGEHAPQVRLAEANFLLRNHAANEAMLARAIGQINAVLKETPDSLAALSLLAEASMLGDAPKLREAIASLERAAALYPGEPSLVVRLIAALQQAGEFERAGRYLRGLAKLSSVHPQLQPVELRLLASQSDFETALVRAAALVNETSPPSDQLILATIAMRAGRNDQARQIYERLLSAAPADSLTVTQAAEFYANIGEFERGITLLEGIEVAGDAAAKAVLIGGFHQRYGRPEQAGEWLRKAVEENPKSTAARNELARHYLSQGDRPRAREQALEGLRIDPRDERLRATLAIANLDQPGPERQKSLAWLREFASDDDDLRASVELLEQVPFRQGKLVPTDRNLAAAQKLVADHGGFMPAWLLAISLYIEAGRDQDAEVLARRAVSRFPSEVEPAQWSTQLLMRSKRWNDALVEAYEWKRREIAQTLLVDAVIASILLELRRPADALQLLEPKQQQIVNERAEQPDRLVVYLKALAQSEQLDRALQLAQPLFDDPRWRQAWLGIAASLEPDAAVRALQALASRALTAEEHLLLADQYTQLGGRSGLSNCYELALEHARKAGEQEELKAASLIAQGVIAEARQDWSSAEKLYREVIQRDPQNAPALNNLAHVLAREPARCEEALALIDQALRISPDQPDFLDTYGVVLLGLDRLPEAQSALSQALAARPEDVGINLNLIEVLLRSEQIDAAQLEMDEVEEKIRTSPRADPEALRRLNSLREKLHTQQTAMSAASKSV